MTPTASPLFQLQGLGPDKNGRLVYQVFDNYVTKAAKTSCYERAQKSGWTELEWKEMSTFGKPAEPVKPPIDTKPSDTIRTRLLAQAKS